MKNMLSKNRNNIIFIFVVLIVLVNLFFELKFAVSVERFRNQLSVDKYVNRVNEEYKGKVHIYQLRRDGLTFVVSSEADLSDLEEIVDEFSEWIGKDSRIEFISEIQFVGEDVKDSLRPRSSDLNLVYNRENSNSGFDNLTVKNIDDEKYALIAGEL